jgi:hypothetical protein
MNSKKIKEEVFATVDLAIGKVDILEGKGIHFFNAMEKSNGDSIIILKMLMLELVVLNGIKIKQYQLDEMLIKDISYLSEIISNMMSNSFKAGI